MTGPVYITPIYNKTITKSQGASQDEKRQRRDYTRDHQAAAVRLLLRFGICLLLFAEMGEIKIKSIETYLCPGCAKIIDGSPLKAEPTGDITDAAQPCPWCQKKKAFSKYRIGTKSQIALNANKLH